MRLAGLLVVVPVVLVVGCEVRGRTCVTAEDCGDPSEYVCRFPVGEGEPFCPAHGTCASLALDCRLADVHSPVMNRSGPGVGGEELSRQLCSCARLGMSVRVNRFCPTEPVYAPDVSVSGLTCGCPDDAVQAVVHTGPRAASEMCFDATGNAVGPSPCCDCTLAVPSWVFCATPDHRLPDACCNCFTNDAPDPAGRCLPPAGTEPLPARWCCPIDPDPDAGAGTDAR